MTRTTEGPAAQILFGIPVARLTMSEMVELCGDRLLARQRVLVGCVNAAKIVAMRSDRRLRQSVLESDVIVADGQSVVLASKLLRRPLPERVAGIDLFERLLEKADREGLRVYLLGARPDVLDSVCQHIGNSLPGVKIVGATDGYFQADELPGIAERIRASRADMLFIGMGSPMKENFLSEYGSAVDVPILHGVGGSFDVLGGVTKRAPLFWQHSGFEWLYRLLQEPRRLWWRYASSNVVFVGMTVVEMFRRPAPAPRPTVIIDLTSGDKVNDVIVLPPEARRAPAEPTEP